jgi:hypothetical protein
METSSSNTGEPLMLLQNCTTGCTCIPRCVVVIIIIIIIISLHCVCPVSTIVSPWGQRDVVPGKGERTQLRDE